MYGTGGGLCLKVQPLALIYTIFKRKGTPFIPFIDKSYPFHMLVWNCASLLTAINAPSFLSTLYD